MAGRRSTILTLALAGREELSVQQDESSFMVDTLNKARKIETEWKTKALQGACLTLVSIYFFPPFSKCSLSTYYGPGIFL